MADYSNSKSGPGGVFLDDAIESEWNRIEPLITPTQLQNRHLFGIPLVSAMKDPITNRAMVMTPEMLKDVIDRAVSMLEIDTGVDIFPTRVQEKHPFDRHEFESWGYLRVKRRPVATIDKLTITPASGVDVFEVPQSWIETAYLPTGQINLVPILVNQGATGASATGNILFLQLLQARPWMPALWLVEYTSGFPNGQIPRIVNELIGVYAAIEVLSLLGSTYAKSTGHSLGIDSMSQSVSTPGPQLFETRIAMLKEKRTGLIGKMRSLFGTKLFSSTV